MAAAGELVIDPRYKRDLSSRRSKAIVARILARFSWAKFQPPTVVAAGEGRWFVVDGQHRAEAAKQHPLIDFIPCYIIDAPEWHPQADSFVAGNVDPRGDASAPHLPRRVGGRRP